MLRISAFPFHIIAVFIIVILGKPNLLGQQLNHVLGEVLIELEDGMQMEAMANKIDVFENQRTGVQYKKIVLDPMKIWRVKFDHNRINEYRFLEEIRSMREVKVAQFNHLIQYRNIPDDPQFAKQWQYINDGSNGGVEGADIDMDLAWDITTGGLTANGDTIVACVIDGGMDPDHLDYGDNLWVNRAEIPDNGIDDDMNGYIDDYDGWNSYSENDAVFEGGSHGTPVAGIIGAKGNNGIGVAGVNWNVKLMIIKGGGNEAEALAAYAYPYTMRKKYNETNGAEGAFVVTTNASWGADLLWWEDAPLWCSLYDSLGSVGILNCGATANANYNVDVQGDMPTSCPSDFLISVTNMNRNDNKVNFAGYGLQTIDLGAFGADTWTTAIGNSYGGFGGTSGATPHVTGAVALAYSTDCQLIADLAKSDPAQAALLIKEFILNGVVPNESLNGKTLTGGRLNINNSLLLLENVCGDCPFPVSIDYDTIGGDMAVVSWQVNGGESDFNMIFREEGKEIWDSLTQVQSPFIFDSLTYCTSYEFQLKTICSPDSGVYSFSFNFKTEGCCVLPDSHELLMDGHNFTIILKDILATDTYQFEYKKFGESSWASVQADTNILMLPALEMCQFYNYRFKSLCGEGDSGFSKVYKAGVTCEGCAEFQMCSIEANNFFEYIDTINLGGFVNGSGPDKSGYGAFDFASAGELIWGDTYNFALTPGFNDKKYEEYIKVFVDYNIDGEFGEGELALSLHSNAGEKVEGIIEVPDTIKGGYSKMRVIMSFQDFDYPCDNTLDYGEIEDYCIFLNNTVSECIKGDFVVDTVQTTTHESTLNWDRAGGSLSYTYRYKILEDSVWTSGETLDTSILLTGLDSCANYEFQLKGLCIDGHGNYSSSFEFETDCISTVIETSQGLVEVHCYPNPFSDEMFLQFDKSYDNEISITIYDAFGKRLLNDSKYHLDGDRRISLNASALQNARGIIFIVLTIEGQKIFLKQLAL